jgi:hypothetical protein
MILVAYGRVIYDDRSTEVTSNQGEVFHIGGGAGGGLPWTDIALIYDEGSAVLSEEHVRAPEIRAVEAIDQGFSVGLKTCREYYDLEEM